MESGFFGVWCRGTCQSHAHPSWCRISPAQSVMKLLIYSHFFAPSVGGVESIVMSLARGLAQHLSREESATFEVILVTQTPGANFDDGSLPFRVIRRPGANHF